MKVAWRWLPFSQLSLREFHDVLQLRQAVFVVEQRCTYLDVDGLDLQCWHGFGLEGDVVVASARILPPGLVSPMPSIGRVATALKVRGRGLGRELMQEALATTQRLYPGQSISISAQVYLKKFYSSLGFVARGADYDEDGIAHVKMIRSEVHG
jgi:ElaA protein